MSNSKKRNFVFIGITAVLMAVTLLACPSPAKPDPPVVDTTSPVVAGTPEQEPRESDSTYKVALRFAITEENAVSYVSGVTDATLKADLGTITVGGTNPSSEVPTIDSATLDTANKKIVITLTDGTELIEGNTLTIAFPANIIQDAAGNKNNAATLVATVVEDDTPPTLKTVTASDSSRDVVLTFDEYVTYNSTVADLKAVFTVYSDGSNSPTTEITVDAAAGDRTDIITLTLAEDLTAGNKIKIDISTGLTDLAGNDITSPISETVTVADGTIPRLSSISADDSQADIVLTFSEAVTAAAGDFSVTSGAAGSTFLPIKINSIAGSGSATITLTLAETPAVNNIIKVLVGIGVKDGAGNSVLPGSEKSGVVADKTPPTLKEIKTNSNNLAQVTLIFSEKVTAETIDFTVYSDSSDPPTTLKTIDSISGSGTETIVLTLATGSALTDGENLKVSITGGLTDVSLAGTPNSIEQVETTVTIADDAEAPTLDSMDEPNDVSRRIVLNFSEAVDTTNASASDFTVTSDDQDPPATPNVVQSFTGSGTSRITLTLTDDLVAGNKVKVVINGVADTAGNTITANAEVTGTVVDLSLPTLDSLSADDSSKDIALTFSEAVDAEAGHFSVTAGSSPNTVASVSGSGSASITLTLTDDLVAGETLHVDVTTGLTDAADHSIKAGTRKTTVVADAVLPTLTGLTASDDAPRSAVLTFSEKVVGAETGDFTVYSDTADTPTTVISVTAVSGDGTDTITLTLAEDLIANENIKVDIADGAVTDTGKNPIAAASSSVETVADKTAPTLTELSANSGTTQAKLTFSEPVTAETADFEAYSDAYSTPVTPIEVESVEGSGTADITLNLQNELVFGNSIKVIVLGTLTDTADTPHSIQQIIKSATIADKLPPSLEEVIPAAAKQVMLKFSESVKAVKGDFDVYSDSNDDPSTQNDVTGITGSHSSTITLTLTTDLVGGENLKVVVGSGVLDFADNAAAADTSMTVAIAADNTAPTLSSISANDGRKEVVLTFDEAVIAAIGNFTVYADDKVAPDTENAVIGVAGSGSEEIKLSLTDDLTKGDNVRVDVAETLTDIAGNQITAVSKTAEIIDGTPPLVEGTPLADNDNSGGAKIAVTFSEPIIAGTEHFSVQTGTHRRTVDSGNVFFDFIDNPVDNPVTGIEGTDTGAVTLILQNDLIAWERFKVTTKAGITDTHGNALIQEIIRVGFITDAFPAALQGISADNGSPLQVVLTFDKRVYVTATDFAVTSGPDGSLTDNVVTSLAGSSTDTITLTLTNALTAGEKINVVIHDPDNEIEDTDQTVDISDVIAPAAVSIAANDVADGNNGKVVIIFDEAVSVNRNHFAITSDSKADPTAHNPVTGSTGDGTTEITLTLENKLTAGENIKVFIGEGGVTDAAGNAMPSWTGTAAILDKTPPSLLKIVIPDRSADPGVVELIFSEPVAAVNDDFTVTSGSSSDPTTTTYSVVTLSGTQPDTLKLTLDKVIPSTDQSIKVAVGTEVADGATPENNADSHELIASLDADTTSPTLDSISADDSAKEVVLTFSERVDTEFLTHYEVYSGGVTAPYALNAVTDLTSIGENKIVLTLQNDLLAGENIRVVVKETLKDVNGNAIAAGTEITEIIADASPPVLESIAANSAVRGAVLTFSEAVRAAKSDFTVTTGPAGDLDPNEVIAISGDGTDTITLFLSVDPTDKSYKINVAVKTTLTDLAGRSIAPGAVLEGDISRPEYRSVSTVMSSAIRGSVVTLQFSEDVALKTTETLSVGDFNVYSDDKAEPDEPVDLTGAAFDVSGDTITITLANDVKVHGGNRIKADITPAGLAKLQDTSGNDAKGAVSHIGEVKYAYTPTTKAELKEAIDTEMTAQGNTADLNIIDTSAITDMRELFSASRRNFSGDISRWNTANVKTMYGMFSGTRAFNQDLVTVGDIWNTSKVTNMERMFYGATAFAGDIKNWDTSSATNMVRMFQGASGFNQDLSNWDVGNLQIKTDFNTNSGLTDAHLPKFDAVDLAPIITRVESVVLNSGSGTKSLSFLLSDIDGIAYNGETSENSLDNFISDVEVELFIGTGDFLGAAPTLTQASYSTDSAMITLEFGANTYTKGNVLRITFPAGLFKDTPTAASHKTEKTSEKTEFEIVIR